MQKLRVALVAALAGGLILVGSSAYASHGTATFGGPGMGTLPHAASDASGGLEAAAIGKLGAECGEAVESVLDLPALNIDRDANGNIVMDLPALKICEAGKHKHAHHAHPAALPKTGVEVGDLLALGFAALSAGAIVLRRLRHGLSA